MMDSELDSIDIIMQSLDKTISRANWRDKGVLAFQDELLILITGTTGYLGKFILQSILENTIWKVWCIVRPGKYVSPWVKQYMAIKDIFTTKLLNQFLQRVTIVPGDLEESKLGLNTDFYKWCIENIDLIIHNGAKVNFVSEVTKLKRANIDSTLEIITMALHGKNKHLHFISTINVLPLNNPKRNGVLDENSLLLEDDLQYMTGYAKSKWICEKMLSKAYSYGLSITISRPGYIGPHSTLDFYNRDDFLILFLQTILLLRKFPLTNIPILSIPVDYVANAILYTSVIDEKINTDNMFPPVFLYLGIAQNNLSLDSFVRIISDEMRVELEPLEADKFITFLNNNAKKHRKLYAASIILNYFPNHMDNQNRYVNLETQFILSKYSLPLPSLDINYSQNYVKSLILNGDLSVTDNILSNLNSKL